MITSIGKVPINAPFCVTVPPGSIGKVPTNAPLCVLQSLQILDMSEAQTQLGMSPHEVLVSHSLPPLDARSRPPAEFVENLLQVMLKLFPDQMLHLSSDSAHRIDVEGQDVFVEVTGFEPMQDILVCWNLKVRSCTSHLFWQYPSLLQC